MRTATGLAVLTLVAVVLLAGSADRVMIQAGVAYESLLGVYRGAFFLAPPLVFAVTLRVCRELRDHELHPLRGETGTPEELRPPAAHPLRGGRGPV